VGKLITGTSIGGSSFVKNLFKTLRRCGRALIPLWFDEATIVPENPQ
jgi:hypothetical protein